MASTSALGRYRAALRKVVDQATGSFKRTLLDDLQRLMSLPYEELVEELAYLLRDYMMVYGDEAATIAADFYEELAEQAGVKVPDPKLYQFTDEEYAEFVEGRADDLLSGDVDQFMRKMQDTLANMVKTSANRTMGDNAVATNKSKRRAGGKKGGGVRFARVPTGPTTCAFCTMLASRGFVYASRETAGQFEKYHPHCDCLVVPEFGGEGVEGYDPEYYLEKWRDAGGDLKQLRRNLEAERREESKESSA